MSSGQWRPICFKFDVLNFAKYYLGYYAMSNNDQGRILLTATGQTFKNMAWISNYAHKNYGM